MNYFDRSPIIQQALFLLEEAAKPEGIKLTQTGSLNRNFVQSFWDQTIKVSEKDSRFRPTRELERPEATRICFFLSDSKYVRKFKSKLQLVPCGSGSMWQWFHVAVVPCGSGSMARSRSVGLIWAAAGDTRESRSRQL